MSDNLISETTSYLGVEEFVTRNTSGTPTAFNYSGIFTKMKNYLLQYHDDKSYKGRCNDFIHIFARFYENSFYGELGKMTGKFCKITKGGENLTYAMGVGNISDSAYSTKRSGFTYPHIITKNMS